MQTAMAAKRFFSVLGNALEISLETTVLREGNLAFLERLASTGQLNGYAIRDPNARGDKPEAKTISITHSAGVLGFDFLDLLLSRPAGEKQPRFFYFDEVPPGVAVLFQRLNFKQSVADGIKGMVCGRRGEAKPFPIRQPNGAPYLNLDLFSRAPVWNPLFVKYRLTTTRPESEFGYLGIYADKEKTVLNEQLVAVHRVDEREVPEFLKTAPTHPD